MNDKYKKLEDQLSGKDKDQLKKLNLLEKTNKELT